MEAAIRLLNEMVTRGLLDNYAIGGAMASLFYAEPVATFDLDVFVLLPTAHSDRTIVTLEPQPDRRLLDEILERHGLRGRWDQWTKGPHV